jgi:hypothetical protein
MSKLLILSKKISKVFLSEILLNEEAKYFQLSMSSVIYQKISFFELGTYLGVVASDWVDRLAKKEENISLVESSFQAVYRRFSNTSYSSSLRFPFLNSTENFEFVDPEL